MLRSEFFFRRALSCIRVIEVQGWVLACVCCGSPRCIFWVALFYRRADGQSRRRTVWVSRRHVFTQLWSRFISLFFSPPAAAARLCPPTLFASFACVSGPVRCGRSRARTVGVVALYFFFLLFLVPRCVAASDSCYYVRASAQCASAFLSEVSARQWGRDVENKSSFCQETEVFILHCPTPHSTIVDATIQASEVSARDVFCPKHTASTSLGAERTKSCPINTHA